MKTFAIINLAPPGFEFSESAATGLDLIGSG